MISMPRFDLRAWQRGARRAWISMNLWVGPAYVTSMDCNDSDVLESSLTVDVYAGGALDDWYTLGFLCTCGSCTVCDPPNNR